MFFGEYQYKVDEKGRVPLPPKFRREMKEGVILAKGMDEKCITAYTHTEWKRLSDNLASKKIGGAGMRKVNRALFGSAFSTSFDGQGRVTLPWPLRNYAEIGDTVLVIGANSCVELWSEEGWKLAKTSAEEEASPR